MERTQSYSTAATALFTIERREPALFPAVVEFGIALLERHGTRFERHAANRAGAWLAAHDFRMHRTRPLGGGCCLRSDRLQRHPTLGTRAWPLLADFGGHRGRYVLIRCATEAGTVFAR